MATSGQPPRVRVISKRPLRQKPPPREMRPRRFDPDSRLAPPLFRGFGFLLGLAFLLASGILIKQGVVEAATIRAEYQQIQARTEQRRPPRGQIFDRNRTPLAESVVTYDCWAVAKVIDTRVLSELADMLAEVTDTPARELEEVLTSNSPQLFLYRDMDLEMYRKLRQWRYVTWNKQVNAYAQTTEGKALIEREFNGKKSVWYDTISKAVGNIVIQPVHRRRYPMGHLAGQLLGFVTEQQEGFAAGGGVELWNDTALAGAPQTVPLRYGANDQVELGVQGKPALGVQLTLDADLQAYSEQALAAGLLRTRSRAGVAVVMDAQSGDILAAANVPVFDPELYAAHCQPQLVETSVLDHGPAAMAMPLKVACRDLPSYMQAIQPQAAQEIPLEPSETDDGVVLAPELPAMEGRPLLLTDWPPSRDMLESWDQALPPGLVPGIANEHMRNGVLGWQVEPGSIFKPFAMLSALEHGVITPETRFPIGPAPFRVPGASITDHHSPSTTESWTASQVLVESSNKGMARIAMQTGREAFLETFAKFHFSEPLLGLKGENKGSMGLHRDWYPSELATMAFGQGLITATPLQLTAAMNALATGSYAHPRLVSAIQQPDEQWRPLPNRPREATLDLDSTIQVRKMLELVVTEGTGKKAAVEDFAVAGKTGTAWKAIGGNYNDRIYISSFLGYGPAEAPRYTVLVMYDDPKVDKYGGSAAAPVFAEIMDWLHRRELRSQPILASQPAPIPLEEAPLVETSIVR